MKSKISKSQFMKGLQCHKALWLGLYRKDLKPEIPLAQQNLFDQGHEVGNWAKKLFPKGVEIHAEYFENEKAVELTKMAIKEGKTSIFEATAICGEGLYARVDILRKSGTMWDLIEVKSSTKVSDNYLWDVAAQRFAFEKAGFKIRKTLLMLVNTDYVREGEIEVEKLFKFEDISEHTKNLQKEVGKILPQLLEVVTKRKEPKMEIGNHCFRPYECEFKHHCWAHVPEFSVFDICYGSTRENLLAQGILDAKDIPEGILSDRKEIDLKCAKSGKMHLEKENLKTFLRLLEKPLYFLDFETINPAIPLYDGTSPYGKIPFQFSCHIQKGANLAQEEYLHDGFSDPRLTLIKALIKTLGKKGSIVAYNANFEISVIKGLANQFPKYQKELMALTERFVDLLMPFRSRHIYHPDMKGSASLKSVIPVFEPGLNYEQLEIKDGGGASEVYKAICKGSIEGIEKDKMMEALREYCMLDTLAMVKLVEVLENLTKERK